MREARYCNITLAVRNKLVKRLQLHIDFSAIFSSFKQTFLVMASDIPAYDANLDTNTNNSMHMR